MNVKELKEWLAVLPDHATVHIGDATLHFDCSHDAPNLDCIVSCRTSTDEGPLDYVVLLPEAV